MPTTATRTRSFAPAHDGLVPHRLNPAASLIWKLVSKGKNADETAHALAEEFDVGLEDAKQDVAGFLARLASLGLIEGQ